MIGKRPDLPAAPFEEIRFFADSFKGLLLLYCKYEASD